MYELFSDGSIPQHPLLDLKMKPPTIVDYMTDMSGVTATMLQSAVSMEQGLQRARGVLGPQVTLLGWNLQNDIDWLQLKPGVHYREAVDHRLVQPPGDQQAGQDLHPPIPTGTCGNYPAEVRRAVKRIS